MEEELLDNAHFWYVPVELFHRLHEIDEARHKSIGTKLIHSVRFIPSMKRTLYHQLKLLTPDEIKAFNSIIQNGIKEIIYDSDKYHDSDMCVAARQLLDPAGVKYRQYNPKTS